MKDNTNASQTDSRCGQYGSDDVFTGRVRRSWAWRPWSWRTPWRSWSRTPWSWPCGHRHGHGDHGHHHGHHAHWNNNHWNHHGHRHGHGRWCPEIRHLSRGGRLQLRRTELPVVDRDRPRNHRCALVRPTLLRIKWEERGAATRGRQRGRGSVPFLLYVFFALDPSPNRHM